MIYQIRSDQISRSVVSDSLRPHESQHAKASLSITNSQSSLRLMMDVEGIWSGLSVQKPGDQMLEGQARGRHSAQGGKRIQRKSVPYRVYMPIYQIAVAEHFNIVLR